MQIVWNLLQIWSRILSCHETGLGHSTVFKHSKLSNDTSFKERHQWIPPGMYKEAWKHLEEILDCCGIRDSSNIMLVCRKDGSLHIWDSGRHTGCARWPTSLPLHHGYLQMVVVESLGFYECSHIHAYNCTKHSQGLTSPFSKSASESDSEISITPAFYH